MKILLRYLSPDIICSEKQTVFREQSSRKTVCYEEQIMSKDKYLSIFSPQMAAIVFIILQIFFTTRALLKIGEYSRIFPSFAWGIFGLVTCLDQSHASEKIWWIIVNIIFLNVCLLYLRWLTAVLMDYNSPASNSFESNLSSKMFSLCLFAVCVFVFHHSMWHLSDNSMSTK